MVRWETDLTDDDIIDRAAGVNVGVYSARRQYLNPTRQREFVFGYAELDESTIHTGIQRLAATVSPRRSDGAL